MNPFLAAQDGAGPTSPWDDAVLAARLFAVDPAGLGGVVLRGPASPIREAWLEALKALLPPGTPMRRLPASIADDRLLGGIDLAASLKMGQPILQHGVLIEANGGVVLIPMAERLAPAVAARIAAVLDQGAVTLERDGMARRVPTMIGLVALDEGARDEEQPPAVLTSRLAFPLDFQQMGGCPGPAPELQSADILAARARLGAVGAVGDDIVEALAKTALSFGIRSLMAPLLALKAARAAAALAGRDAVTGADAATAARLVLAPRALSLPEQQPDAADQPPPQTQEAQNPGEGDSESPRPLDDMLCEAVKIALPPNLLQSLTEGRKERMPVVRDGSGAARMSVLRGRPLGARMGALRAGARLALVDTLRAAAPWQPLRRAERLARDGQAVARIDVRREDFRIRQFAQRRETAIVFCVDASGSAAFHRLAEAKGAVELLLGEAYVARTYAALIAFRGTAADILLPPSRSLTRAKALLSTLPGGGGTPLAAGIEAATRLALGERAKGRQPLIVFLTDGQANIGRDGKASRSQAFGDAMQAAKSLAAQRIAAVFIDTGPRPRPEGGQLSAAMAARYLALPLAQARAVRDFVRAAAP